MRYVLVLSETGYLPISKEKFVHEYYLKTVIKNNHMIAYCKSLYPKWYEINPIRDMECDFYDTESMANIALEMFNESFPGKDVKVVRLTEEQIEELSTIKR